MLNFKITHFGLVSLETYKYEENPIIDIKFNKNFICVVKTNGPLEVWYCDRKNIYFYKLIHLPINFIPDICCLIEERMFVTGVCGSIVEYDHFEYANIVAANSGCIYQLKVNSKGKFLAASTSNGVLIYDIEKSLLSDKIKFITKLQPLSKLNVKEKTTALTWSLDKNIHLAFSSKYVYNDPSEHNLYDINQQTLWDAGKLFIWNLNFLKTIENDYDNFPNKNQFKTIDLNFLAKEEYFPINKMSNLSNQTSFFITDLLYLDDQQLVTGDTYGFVRIWNTLTCNLMQNLSIFHSPILIIALDLTSTESTFYVAGADPFIFQFEKSLDGSWQQTHKRNLHDNDIKSLAHGNSWLVSGGLDSKLVFSRFPPKTIIDIPNLPHISANFCSFCVLESNSVDGIWKIYVLYQYMQHLELWLFKKFNVSTTLEIETAPLHQDFSFESTKLLEIRSKCRGNELFNNLISSTISENGKFIAYTDANNTHLYAIQHASDDEVKIEKIPFDFPVTNPKKKSKKKLKVNNAKVIGVSRIKMLSQHIQFIRLPADYFNLAPSKTNMDNGENEIVDFDVNPFRISELKKKPSNLNNDIQSKDSKNSIHTSSLLIDCLFRITPKGDLIFYPILPTSHNDSFSNTLANGDDTNRNKTNLYCCDLTRKFCIPTTSPSLSDQSSNSICAFQFKIQSLTQQINDSHSKSHNIDNYLALSYLSGIVAVFSIKHRKLLWHIQRTACPSFILRFHPTNSEIILVYPDNHIHEYNYINGEPTLWSTMFNESYVTVSKYDGAVKKIKNRERFMLPWSHKSYKNWRNKYTENLPDSDLVLESDRIQVKDKSTEETLKFIYPVIRDIFYNPQNPDQILVHDLETLYSISKRGCCLTNIECEDSNNFPPIQEIKKCKYINKMILVGNEDIIIIRVPSEQMKLSKLPIIKKKKFGM